jgi:hypothetical protein
MIHDVEPCPTTIEAIPVVTGTRPRGAEVLAVEALDDGALEAAAKDAAAKNAAESHSLERNAMLRRAYTSRAESIDPPPYAFNGPALRMDAPAFSDSLNAALCGATLPAPSKCWVEWDEPLDDAGPYLLSVCCRGTVYAHATAPSAHMRLQLEWPRLPLDLALGESILVSLVWPRGCRHRHVILRLPTALPFSNLVALPPTSRAPAASDASGSLSTAERAADASELASTRPSAPSSFLTETLENDEALGPSLHLLPPPLPPTLPPPSRLPLPPPRRHPHRPHPLLVASV